MLREHESGTPEEWMRIARSDFAYAQAPVPDRGILAVPCFHAQQAVEKSLKAVLHYLAIDFPRTHNLDVLVSLLPQGAVFPFDRRHIAALTDYAATARYPGEYEDITEQERDDAVRLAQGVVDWAGHVISGQTTLI
jgi:HEPN domain-containing protein